MTQYDTVHTGKPAITLGDLFGPATSSFGIPGASGLILRDTALAHELLSARTAGPANPEQAGEDNLPRAVAIGEGGGRIAYCNLRFARLLDYSSPAEIISATANAFDLIVLQERQEAVEAIRKAIATGGVSHLPFHLLKRDGGQCLVEISCSPAVDETGAMVCMLSVFDDVASRITLLAPAAVEARLDADLGVAWRTLFDHSPIGLVIVSMDGRCMLANPAFCQMLGYSAQELAGQYFQTFTHPDDIAANLDAGREMIEGKRPSFQIEKRYLHKDGHTVWVSLSASTVHDTDGQSLFILSQIQDVTAYKRAEHEAKVALERYRAVVDDQTELICRYLPDTTITFVNEAYCRFYGCRPETAVGRRYMELGHVPEEVQAELLRLLGTLSATNRVVTSEHHVVKQDGESRWVQWIDRAIVDGGGNVVEIQGIGRDITERNRVVQALAESEKRYRTLVETATDGILLTDMKGRIAFANLRAARMYGLNDPSEMLGEHITSILAPEDRPDTLADATVTLERGALRDVIHHHLRRDGASFIGESSAALVRGSNDEPVAFMVVVRDVTERQRMEQAEREQRTMSEALCDTASALAGTLEFDQVLDRILANAGRVVPHDTRNIMLLDPPCPAGVPIDPAAGVIARVVRAQGYDLGRAGAFATSRQFPVAEMSSFRSMIETGASLLVRDVQSYPAWISYPETNWLRSYVGTPIIVKGDVVGFLNLDSATPNFFSDPDMTRLRAFADQAGVAIHNSRLYETQRQSVTRLTRVYQAGLTLAQAESMEALLSAITREAVRLIGADGAVLSRFDGGGHLVTAAVDGLPDSLVGMRVALGEGLSGRAAALRAPQHIQDYQRWANRIERLSDHGIEQGVALPLIWQDRLIGTLAVFSRHAGGVDEEETDMLALYGTLAAATLEQRRAFEDAQRREVEARDLARQLAGARDDERSRIAERLHDSIGRQLLTLGQTILTASESLPPGDAQAERLSSSLSLLSEASEQVRSLAIDLDSKVLDESGIAAAARRYVEKLNASIAPPVRFHVTGRVRRMPIEIERVLFRGLKEALSNVLRHALANEVSAQLHLGSRSARLTVEDDGVGFDPSLLAAGNDSAQSFGLPGLRRQVQWLGGEFSIESAPGKGATVVMEIQLPSGIAREGQTVRVLVVDAHDMMRRGLMATLNDGEYECAEASDGLAAIHWAQLNRPDLVLINVELPGLTGIETARQIVATVEHTSVIMLSYDPDDLALEQSIRAGARGFLLKSASSQELFQALRTVRAGEMYVSPRLAEAAHRLQEQPAPADQLSSLTTREREVLDLIVNGYRNKEIAERLGISVRTVEVHRRNLMDKLDAKSLAQLIQLVSRK